MTERQERHGPACWHIPAIGKYSGVNARMTIRRMRATPQAKRDAGDSPCRGSWWHTACYMVIKPTGCPRRMNTAPASTKGQAAMTQVQALTRQPAAARSREISARCSACSMHQICLPMGLQVVGKAWDEGSAARRGDRTVTDGYEAPRGGEAESAR